MDKATLTACSCTDLEHGYTLSEISRAVDLHFSTVSRVVNRDSQKNDAQNKF